jgi:hypothetical protein
VNATVCVPGGSCHQEERVKSNVPYCDSAGSLFEQRRPGREVDEQEVAVRDRHVERQVLTRRVAAQDQRGFVHGP